MAVVAMKKVFIVSLMDYKERMVQQLQKMGILQIVDLKDKINDPEWGASLQEDHLTDGISQLDAKLSELKFAIDFLGRFDQRKKSFIETFTGSKIVMSREDFKTYAQRMDVCTALYRKSRALDEKMNQLRNEASNEAAQIAQMKPWAALDIPLEAIGETKYTQTLMGTVEKDSLAALQEEIAKVAPESFFQIVAVEKSTHHILLTYLKAAETEVAAALRNANFIRAVFPSIRQTPAEAISAMQAKIAKLEKDLEASQAEAREMLSERPFLLAAYDDAAAERERMTVVRNFGRTDRTFVIEGWAKEKDVDRLTEALHQITDAVAVSARSPEEGEAAPIVLKNHRLIEPFEAVTELYAYPVTGGYDPTPVMAPFFFIFFGMMLGDAGYGIVLSALAYLALKKIRMAGLGKKLFELLVLGGIASFFFGVLTGSWFGDLIPIKPIWFNPGNDPLKMLAVSMAIGVIQIVYVGLGLKFYLLARQGKWLDAIYDVASWIVLLTGLMLFGLGGVIGPAVPQIGKILALAGGLTIMWMNNRSQRNPIKRIGSGLYALYGVSSYAGDIFSYSRLLALGLSSGVVASVFNTLGRLLTGAGFIGYIFMVIFLIATHTFNLVINVLGSYVHSSRLQYVEFFGKFYESGGKKFSPFQMATKYVDLD